MTLKEDRELMLKILVTSYFEDDVFECVKTIVRTKLSTKYDLYIAMAYDLIYNRLNKYKGWTIDGVMDITMETLSRLAALINDNSEY